MFCVYGVVLFFVLLGLLLVFIVELKVGNRVSEFWGAHLLLADYCSSGNLHRFVKFVRVQILASFPFYCRNVPESCSDQHHDRAVSDFMVHFNA